MQAQGARLLPVERAFPLVSLQDPVAIAIPEGARSLFVVERGGRVVRLPESEDARDAFTALELRHRTSIGDVFVDLAFHPRFAETGAVFVTQVHQRPARLVLSRYRMSTEHPDPVDEDSEEELLSIEMPFDGHRGGHLAFGPDGLLYLGVGDGGGYQDPLHHAQNRKTLLGTVLRFDVDAMSGVANYAIPLGNPYLGNRRGDREEVFAYGFSDPAHLTFDRASGALWAIDSTAGSGEELNRVRRAGNYGWASRIGTQCVESSPCPGSFLDPVAYLPAAQSRGLVGGTVYRSDRFPKLKDHYLFADAETGRVWKLPVKPSRARSVAPLLVGDAGFPLNGVAVDADGAVMLLAKDGLYRLLTAQSKPAAGSSAITP